MHISYAHKIYARIRSLMMIDDYRPNLTSTLMLEQCWNIDKRFDYLDLESFFDTSILFNRIGVERRELFRRNNSRTAAARTQMWTLRAATIEHFSSTSMCNSLAKLSIGNYLKLNGCIWTQASKHSLELDRICPGELLVHVDLHGSALTPSDCPDCFA